MRAVICTKYGPPEVLQLREIEKPVPKDNELLIKIHATAVTVSDCVLRSFTMPGAPGFPKKQLMQLGMRLFIGISKPRNPVLGMALSGEIESAGKDVSLFKRGDQVYGFTGHHFGGYAEYTCMSQKVALQGHLSLKPLNMSHKQAAAITYGGILALDFMRHVNIQAGDKVLIYGASGAIGSIAVQIAKYFGAEVTGVCSASNFKLVKSLGADKVLDYTNEEAISQLELYGLVFDSVGKNKKSKLKKQCRNALDDNGKYISVDDRFSKVLPGFLTQLKDLCEANHLQAVIDRCYPLEDIVEAHTYVDSGHKVGNVIMVIQ